MDFYFAVYFQEEFLPKQFCQILKMFNVFPLDKPRLEKGEGRKPSAFNSSYVLHPLPPHSFSLSFFILLHLFLFSSLSFLFTTFFLPLLFHSYLFSSSPSFSHFHSLSLRWNGGNENEETREREGEDEEKKKEEINQLKGKDFSTLSLSILSFSWGSTSSVSTICGKN